MAIADAALPAEEWQPPAVVRLWARPIGPALAIIKGTADKPLAELTLPELAAWGMVFSYAVLTGYIAGHLAGNIVVTALRGPGRR